MSDKASLTPAVNRPDVFWKLLECSGDTDAMCAQKWCGPCHVGRNLKIYTSSDIYVFDPRSEISSLAIVVRFLQLNIVWSKPKSELTQILC
ncbi:hypothetical protein Hanom_Chr07g00599291 [Helianthus anomalus]